MHRTDPDVDIIMRVLRAYLQERPDSAFVQSLLQQYIERGGLSRKQLEGLHAKASRIEAIPASHLATLEAIIKKKHVRYKTASTTVIEEPANNPELLRMIREMLEKYPAHKRLCYLQGKIDNRAILIPQEEAEVKRFYGLLMG